VGFDLLRRKGCAALALARVHAAEDVHEEDLYMVAESTLILVFQKISAVFHSFLDFIHCLILFLPTALVQVQVHVQVVGDRSFRNFSNS
jgi:hypothetical protein